MSRGGTTRVYWLAQVAREAGLATKVIGTLRAEETPYPEPPSDVDLRFVPWQRRGRHVPRILDALDSDIIWAVKPRPASYGLALAKRAGSRVPVVLDIDDLEREFIEGRTACLPPARHLSGRLRRGIATFISPDFGPWVRTTERLAPLADAVTVNSSALQARYGGIYVPSGKDIRKFDPDLYDTMQSKRRLGLADYRCIMFPGTPTAHKGVEDVIDALELLGDRRNRLVVVGGRKGGQHYLSGLGERADRWVVRLPGIPADDMPRVLAAADLMVVPQRDCEKSRAQTPMKLTDGMAMAKPIIATRVGDLPNILGNVAALVDPSDSAQLARAIDRILNDDAYAEDLGRAARQRCIADFSLPAAASSFRKVLSDLRRGQADSRVASALRVR
jgi:glycosyltransferase involved in cell wall biosynthesis